MQAQATKRPVRLGPRLYEFPLSNGSKSYRCDISVNGRQTRFTLNGRNGVPLARNRTQARKAQRALEERYERGEAVERNTLTVEHAVDRFLESFEEHVRSAQRAPRTLETHTYRLRSRVVPLIGNLRLQDVTPDDIARCVSTWQKQNDSPWTIIGTRGSLSKLFRFCQRRRWLADNPLNKMTAEEWPRIVDSDKRVLSLAEIRKLIQSASTGSKALLATLALSGLRQSEALGLTWADVDFDGRCLYVRAQLGRDGQRTELLKTQAARREVLLHPGLAELLKKQKADAFAKGHARPESFVFSTSSGRPYGHRNATRALAAACAKAKLEGVTTHSLRHGFVSWLILGLGLDPHRVAKQVGHTRPSFTMDAYAHLFEQANHREELRRRIDNSDFGKVLGSEQS